VVADAPPGRTLDKRKAGAVESGGDGFGAPPRVNAQRAAQSAAFGASRLATPRAMRLRDCRAELREA
jgi:hypothetical protein